MSDRITHLVSSIYDAIDGTEADERLVAASGQRSA
jgi:hypothetical protein